MAQVTIADLLRMIVAVRRRKQSAATSYAYFWSRVRS